MLKLIAVAGASGTLAVGHAASVGPLASVSATDWLTLVGQIIVTVIAFLAGGKRK